MLLPKCCRTFRTDTVDDTVNPVWESELPFSIEKLKETEFLYISVFDEDVGINQFMGALTIPVKALKAGDIITETYSLKSEIYDNVISSRKRERMKRKLENIARSLDRDPSMNGSFGKITLQLGVGYIKRPSGEFMGEITCYYCHYYYVSINLHFVNANSAANLMYRPSWRSIIGQLKVEVCSAIGLKDKDDYHVQLSVEGRQESTFEVQAKKPAWNEIFVFEITEITTQVKIKNSVQSSTLFLSCLTDTFRMFSGSEQLYLSLIRDEDKVMGVVQIPIRVLANEFESRDLELPLELLPPGI